MFNFDKIPPREFTLLATLLGILLTFSLDVNEQNSLGNFIVSIGQSLLTNAAQTTAQENLSMDQQQYSDICQKVDQLNAQLADLKKKLK